MSLLPLLHRQQIRFMKINSNIQISPSKIFLIHCWACQRFFQNGTERWFCNSHWPTSTEGCFWMEIVKVLRNCQLTGGQAIINSIGLFSCAIKTKPEMSVYAIIKLLLTHLGFLHSQGEGKWLISLHLDRSILKRRTLREGTGLAVWAPFQYRWVAAYSGIYFVNW